VTTVVIPFAGAEGKTRPHASGARHQPLLGCAGDVLAAAPAVGVYGCDA
jgi:hypothetical protein